MTSVTIHEEQRQLLVLGLALMSLSRPGFEHVCRETAKLFDAEAMYDSFRESNSFTDTDQITSDLAAAVIRYDQSIAGRAAKGEVDLLDYGGVAEGEDLDALYLDMITKARACKVQAAAEG